MFYFFQERFLFLLIHFLYFVSLFVKRRKATIFVIFSIQNAQNAQNSKCSIVDFSDLSFLLCEKKFLIWCIYSKHVCLHKRKLLIWCLVNMPVAFVVEIKTKISFFLCANLLLFSRHKQNKYFEGLTPISHQGFALVPLGDLERPQNPSCIQERYALLQVFIWITNQFKRLYFDHCWSVAKFCYFSIEKLNHLA